jgi:hypothetical protein
MLSRADLLCICILPSSCLIGLVQPTYISPSLEGGPGSMPGVTHPLSCEQGLVPGVLYLQVCARPPVIRWNDSLELGFLIAGSSSWSSRFVRGLGRGRTTLDHCTQPFLAIFARGCFQDLNPWPPGHTAAALTTAPRLPFLLGKKALMLLFNNCIQQYNNKLFLIKLCTLQVREKEAFSGLVFSLSKFICASIAWAYHIKSDIDIWFWVSLQSRFLYLQLSSYHLLMNHAYTWLIMCMYVMYISM